MLYFRCIIKIIFINLLVFISLDFGHLKEGKNKYNNNRTDVEKNVVHLHMIMLFKYVARCRFREKHRKDSTIMPISFFHVLTFCINVSRVNIYYFYYMMRIVNHNRFGWTMNSAICFFSFQIKIWNQIIYNHCCYSCCFCIYSVYTYVRLIQTKKC